MLCPRSVPSTKRFIRSSPQIARESAPRESNRSSAFSHSQGHSRPGRGQRWLPLHLRGIMFREIACVRINIGRALLGLKSAAEQHGARADVVFIPTFRPVFPKFNGTVVQSALACDYRPRLDPPHRRGGHKDRHGAHLHPPPAAPWRSFSFSLVHAIALPIRDRFSVADQPASVPAPPMDIRSSRPASAAVTRLRPARLAA